MSGPTAGNLVSSLATSNSTSAYAFTDANVARERAKFKRHLEAIFALDCICEDATCAACIAEHALYYEGDHESTT